MLPATAVAGVLWIKTLYTHYFFEDPEGYSLPSGERVSLDQKLGLVSSGGFSSGRILSLMMASVSGPT